MRGVQHLLDTFSAMVVLSLGQLMLHFSQLSLLRGYSQSQSLHLRSSQKQDTDLSLAINSTLLLQVVFHRGLQQILTTSLSPQDLRRMPSKFLLHEQVRRLQQRVHNQVSTISTLQTTEREMVQRLSMSQTSEECQYSVRKQAIPISTRSTYRIPMSEKRPTFSLLQNGRVIRTFKWGELGITLAVRILHLEHLVNIKHLQTGLQLVLA